MTICTGFAAREAHAPLAPFTFERRSLRPDDVAISIDYCGVCHTDAHYVHNDWNSTHFPCVPGHEIVGRVTGVGTAARKFQVGERVAVGSMVDSCRQCEPCREGQEQMCVQGLTPTYNGRDRQTGAITYGGYSSQIVVREDFVLRVPASLDPKRAAPLLCAGITMWNPLRRHGVARNSKVAIVGLGGLGHLGVKLAAALGARATVITTSPGKVDDARALGAHEVLLSTEPQAMKQAAGSFDLILDTVPRRHDVNPYLMLLGRGGVLALVGALELLDPVHGALLMLNNRSIAGSLMGGLRDTQELLDFCAQNAVLPDCELIGIEDVDTAFKRMQENDVRYRFVIDMASLGEAER